MRTGGPLDTWKFFLCNGPRAPQIRKALETAAPLINQFKQRWPKLDETRLYYVLKWITELPRRDSQMIDKVLPAKRTFQHAYQAFRLAFADHLGDEDETTVDAIFKQVDRALSDLYRVFGIPEGKGQPGRPSSWQEDMAAAFLADRFRQATGRPQWSQVGAMLQCTRQRGNLSYAPEQIRQRLNLWKRREKAGQVDIDLLAGKMEDEYRVTWKLFCDKWTREEQRQWAEFEKMFS